MDMLVEMYHLVGVGHPTVGQLRDVHQSVLMNSHIDKGAKGGNVGDDARQHHPLLQVFDASDIGVELEYLNTLFD